MKLDEEVQLRGGARRTTFLELLVDLVYVFLLFQLSSRVVDNLENVTGSAGLSRLLFESGRALVLLLALWSVWWGTAWTTSRYNPQLLRIQAIVILTIVCCLVMGLTLPLAFSDYAIPFAVAYVTAQVGRPLILAFALSGERLRLKTRMVIYFSATGVLWISGALIGGWQLRAFWVTALAAEALANRFGWPVPGLGRSPLQDLSIAGEHLGERYQQFFLVVLGEAILGAGLTLTSVGLHPERLAAFVVSLTITMLFWRIYFYRAGLILSEAIIHSPHPSRIGQSTADTHFVMVAGVFITSIGYQLAIINPTSRSAVGWIIVILGPVLFIAGRARFEYEVFGRVSRSRWISLIVLFAFLPLLASASPLVVAAVVVVTLLGVAIADARRARGRPPEPPAPPL